MVARVGGARTCDGAGTLLAVRRPARMLGRRARAKISQNVECFTYCRKIPPHAQGRALHNQRSGAAAPGPMRRLTLTTMSRGNLE